MIMAINLNTFQWKKHEMALNKMPYHELKINGAINPCFFPILMAITMTQKWK